MISLSVFSLRSWLCHGRRVEELREALAAPEAPLPALLDEAVRLGLPEEELRGPRRRAPTEAELNELRIETNH